MKRKIKRGLKTIAKGMAHNLYHKPMEVVKLLLHPGRYISHESYFPERPRKSGIRIWTDQLIQTLRFGSPNEFYFPYGFDVKGKDEMERYLHYEPFMKLRDSLNVSPHSATAILRDKMLFGVFTEYMGVATATNMGLSSGDGVFDMQSRATIKGESFVESLPDGIYFIKPVDGECGAGIVRLKVAHGCYEASGKAASIEDISTMLALRRYLIQKVIEQHPILASLHPQSLNTIRLVSVRDITSGKIDVFPSILRIGTGDSTVDNTSQGGLAVGIELDSGRLKEYGYYKPTYGTRVNRHPDSGIRFDEVTIPYFREAKSQALRLHSMLPSIHSIGWDIAISPDGPVFVEGNDNWEINGPQICNGGLRQMFERYSGK